MKKLSEDEGKSEFIDLGYSSNENALYTIIQPSKQHSIALYLLVRNFFSKDISLTELKVWVSSIRISCY